VTPRSFRSLALLLLAAPLAAQDPRAAADVARAREALKPIAGIVGTWEGEASVRTGPGEPMKVLQSEDIVWGASQTVIMVRGTGRDPGTRSIVFEAAATIWFDGEAGKVRMRTHRDGRGVEPDVQIKPDTIVWGFPVQGGRIVYTIALTADTWHETGDYVPDGRPAMRTIDMRLKRTPR
jgi:hypothetical protein